MTKRVGYKQAQVHYNSAPELKTKINELSSIGIRKLAPGSLKTANKDVFMANAKSQYFFSVNVKGNESGTAFKHSCFFDKKEDAENAHKKLRLNLYDQKTKYYLDKIGRNKRLSLIDEKELLDIFDEFDDLKKIN